MQMLVRLAAQFDRKVAFVGPRDDQNSQIAQRLGYLEIPPGVVVRDSEVRDVPPKDVLCIATGSQGEPQAALSRIAIDDHRHVRSGRATRSCCRPAPSPATRRRSRGS